MRKHSTHSISRVFFSLLMLMIAGVNLTMAQGLSSNDIKASWDFKNGTVAYSIVSADIPAGSTFSWKVDSKNVTDGISDSGQTITLPLTNKTRSGDVTITSADNTSQTIAFSIEPKAYGVDYDGNHFYADSYQLYPDGSEGDGSKEKPFLISNDMELARLAHEVNNGTAQQMFSQKYFKLTKDIDLSKGLWTSIGTAQGIAKATDGHFFAGKFDGDGRSISNMLICWTFSDLKEASWGLFARLNGKGNNENEYAAVTNLIIDNARIEKLEAHMPLNNANYTVKMGIVVADMTQNAELSNIIIRNSKISDNNESYTTKTKFRIGGIAGYLNNFVSLRIFNISADTEIDMFQNAALNGVEGQVTISCGFGAASKLANQTGYAVWPRNIYVHGAGLKTSANTTQCKKASVMAFIAADNFASKVKDSWYYTPANKATDTYAYNQYGVEKEISATDPSTGEPFGKTFAGLNNLYINQNNLDKRPWLYSNSSKRFSFSSIALKAERGTSDVLTVTTEDGETTSDVYNWYASTDNTEGEQVNSTACNPFTLPRQTYSQYVYAMTVDGSQRTNTVLVEAIGITAELDYDTKPGTYIINVKNDTKENFTNDELGLDITYEWHNKRTLLSETSNEFVRPETATNKDQYNCTVTVKSGGNIIFHKNIKVTIVVYLCPEAVSINGTTYAQGEDNDDEEWGYSPTQAMKTWKGAYSKLSKTGTWDENIIVLMGTSHTDVTNSQYTGFNITSNNRGKSMLKFDDWANAKGESPLFRNATITGDWDGTDYKGTIEIYGAEKGLPIWGDTRFEYITFNNDPVTNNGGDFYKIIYCQYNNLEMGEGIQMTGFGQNSPDYGTIDGAVTTAFHIFGGFNNDGRFFPLSNKKSISDFEQSMPHGKEGFKISIKSGFYSAISAGGRQTSSEKDYNGVMGTPNLPIKCTIEMDIDRKWNDAHNPERGIKGETSKRKSDYDAGIILAGSHEGAMYADVDIIIRSGKVARVVNGSLGAQRDFILPYNGTDYYVPNNTYMGRANILLDPASSKHNNDEWIDNRVIVTEMYGGSTGRGHTGNVIVNNPFYGYSTITINGGLFEILPAGNTKKDNIFCGIYGAGAGGMNGIGEGDDNADSHTPDKSIAYWNESGDVMLYGPYAVAKDRLVTYHCYNNDDFESFKDVDPTNTNTKIVINGGEFGSTTEPIDGIYGGGSGFMSKGLWSSTAATPNSCGGNVYGKTGATVASLTINGGEFHCKNGVFAGGRGTDFFYSQNPYGGNSGDYKALGKTYGNVELNINGGIFHCPVFGGGYGVADAKEMGTSNVETLSDMARIYGQSSVNIMGGTFYKNIYGGGDMAIVEFDGNATNVVIGDSADIRGSVFAGGNGRRLRPASQAFAAGDGFTQHPELVGLVAGNANVSFAGSTQQAPFIYGDIFGGGNLAQVANDTYVNIYAGNIAGQVFGGGNGDITDGTVTSADVLGNTNVTLAQDEGGTQSVGHGPIDDSFSINVIWFKMWDPVENIFYIWDPDIDNAGDEPATEDTVYEKSKFYANGKFLNPHNIYGGGNLACNVGTYKDADGNVTTTPADGTGLATVMMQKGMTPYELLITDEWKQSYTDNENPHFCVFGGGYGRLTTVGSTDVTVNVDGDYGKYGPNAPSLDLSMGVPNFTVWAVLGGGYAGTVAGNTKVTVDGKTFIRRVFGGGFGDIASTEDNTTGQIGGNTEVYMCGAFTHGDVFGGSAGLEPETASSTHFITVARVIGTTMVEVADDANIYGNVYGGGDNANVGIFQEMKPSDYYSPDLLTSASTLNQADGTFLSYKAEGYRSFVNIRGGNIFGNVYGGGVGCKKAEANQYYNIGRINGNTLVHIVNSNPGVDSGTDNVVPCVWGDIYGGCEYGTVDGNTFVHIEGGMMGGNVYGGGYGDIDIDNELTAVDEVLGKKDVADTGTYANILGNTKVQFDGGSWMWNRKADINGNITTWLDAESDSSPICNDNNEFRRIAYAINEAPSLDNIGDPLAQEAINRIRNNENTKKFFDLDRFTFSTTYNIFGGGNRACHVGSASVANTGKTVVIINHSPLDDIKDSKGKTISMFENTTVQGLCWFLNSIHVEHPSFSLFGAGYGVNTSVGKTEVYAQPGAKLDDDGIITIDGIKYRYLYQNKDYKTYLDLEKDIYDDYLKLSKEDKKLYFGSYDGGENDPGVFRRYHISRFAWKIGVPGLVLLQIHGGGYAGYVTGDTYVETDCQLGCHDIFGAGLGALPYGDFSSGSGYDFGSVKGKSMVFIKGGDVNHSVYGGGSGVESVKRNGVFIDFPDMAHVEKTEVHIYGKMYKFHNGLGLIERTLIFGRVYGGGDLANVGSKKADAAVFTRDNYLSPTNRTTLVNIRGGSLMSQVFAGGRGRVVTECADSKSLGGVYGNSCLILDRPVMHYPYWDDTTKEYLSPSDDANMVHPDVDNDTYPTLMEDFFGGCQNGTVYGNTLLTIYDGWLGKSAHGGGLGSVETVTENGSESVAVTSADVTGNTNLLILGGKVQAHALWNVQARTWSPASIVDGTIYSPQYDPKARKFKVNHNIYGGGKIASVVGNNSYITMTKGLLYNSTEMVAGRDTGKNFFESIEWKEIYEKIGTPQFSVFGGGFGENAIVMGDTYVNVEMEGRGSILEGIDIVKGEEYKHFFNGYSVMDIIGGGYSGKVVGDTHIVGSGGVFCRRVFGGGTYSSVNSTDVELKAIDCHDIFGGGFMGDVLKSTTVRIGDNKPATSPHTYSNADIFIHGNVYGGNDVSGYVNVGLNKNGYFMDNGGTGTTINIYGGHLFGDVYGAGNGNYLYATDRNGNKNVTVNEYYPINPNDPDSETVPLVYTVPMRENMTQSRATSDAVKMVNINSWRPLTNKVSINIQGVSTSDTVRIDGNVYGGGNSATVQKLLAYGASEDTDKSVGDISVNIGNHVRIGGVFMGCNGEELFVKSEDNDFMNMFQKLNGDINDYTQELDFAEPIDWINDSENANISTVYLPTEKSKRPIVYPYLLDLYFQPVETNIQGSLKWNGSETGEGLTDCVIGTFCCGGNRGNMNVLPKTSGKIGNVLEYTFPEGLTITDKIVGGCNNTNYDYKGKAKHMGGYLLGDADSEYPFIKLNIRNKFMPKEKNGAYVGGNVYGGCFKSGTIVGDVLINLQSDMLAGKDKDKLEKSNELLVKSAEYSALNVYGAGYGMESYIYGIANVTIGESVKCSEPKMDGNKFLPCGVVDPDSNPEGLGVSANFVYGGGQQGNVVGYSTIKILNGHIFRAVTGGSYSGYVYGSTQVIVGYPTYYSTNRQNHVRGRYELKRADRKNLGVENDNGKEKTPAIKQHIYLLNDEWISQGVYEDIVAIDNGNGMRDTITDANRAHYFKKIVSAAPSVGWENVNITIDEAVYGGGYSVAQGSVLANNTTVLKLTDKYNLDYAIIANGNGDGLNLLPGGSTAGFCGNTLVLVGDNKDSEHITISHQDIRPVQLPDGTDLYGYYYKHYASDDDAANGIYTYRYISLQDKYFFKSGATPPSGLVGIRENEFYEYDSEGGIFGDGHLSYAQGFRSADLTGYGFAGHTIDNPKILNTFQRLDIIRLEDNCFSLLGARDYTVNDVNKTPYSIARVGEIKMVANDIRFDSNGNLEAKPDNNTDFKYSTKARNYMGFSNNILYVSAITSNVDFNSGMWRNRNGQLAAASTDNTAFAGMSYQGVKQHYIDDYNANKDKEDAEDPFGEFQKRNDGTAMNMIGIASGYAMKIQLCHETYDAERKKVVENKLYGPIYGVVEMNLINVREDEGGGYVYADNNHKRHNGDTHEEDFLETTGNFVFPYHKGRYIVDDCFPTGYHAITAPGSDKTVDDVKVHYWYVTGFHYYYNVNISGYTFKSSKENPLEFDSDNKDGLTVLAGLKSTQPISIFNWKMRSGHPDDKSQYSSDLEYRNYLTGTETNETDKTYYSDAVAGGYKLYVGGAESNNFSGATSIDDPDKASKGFAALLSMREKGDDEATLFNNSLPAGLKEDAKISFRLVDMVDNTNYVEPDYFDKHLGRKSMATLVLKAPAYEEYVSETDNKPIYTNTGKFYKKTEAGYELVESGNLDADNTYYQPQTEEFVKIDNLFTYNTVNKKYEKVDNISNVTIDESNPTVYYVPREYTYTIYLTIEYVQGPTVSGQITIGNCALPGEMVRVTKDNIVVSADQSFAVNGYYWRIGKRQMGADGKWEFKDTTPWTKENISNNVATGYDTFNQADENGKGLFAGCHYDKTDDLLDVPVYYYMNGYGIQLGVSITGLNDILEVDMHDADKFVVHNYHRMDPHKAGINLHLAEAITRVNEESLDTTESDPLPEPRIYISDKSDLSAFVAFVDSIGTDSNAPRYGAKAQFFLQNDIALEATDKGGYYISDFAGILHGDGHVISGIPSGKSLFNNIESSGNIYNLGLASGKISNLTADGKIGNYHCCFEYAPASGKSGSTPVVYRWDGSPDKSYTTEDFRLGRVAYDLNEYYLRARHRDAATTSSTEADADNEILKYVSAYYANGDYQYACRTDAITGKNTGITYLRIGKGGDTPNYEQVETRHDKTHPLDAPRVKYNADGSIPTPVVYTPLFNANNSGTEPMNDFLFWGQSLQHNPDNYPCDIASHQNSYMSNRVYRTAAYYGDTSLDAFHYNAYNNGSITMSTYVHDSATTAVDFTCLHDLPAATETVGGIFYPPIDDNASRFNDFVVREDAGITQNLLVYTADNDEATGNEAYDVVEKALNYNETTREALINGHHITKGIDGYSTTLLHLVERTPDNENGDGETCNNNNLCVPIAFNVNDRAWYVRRPLHYAEDSKGAWEGICLPFTVDKATASLNGEITHFYGSPSDTETDNPSQNIHSLHHEYWLRGLTSIATEGNVPSAVFQRPGAALFSPTDASGNALTNGVSYTFANTFFVDNYADKLYNQYANPYYATAHNYPDYLRLAGEVPYIVRFPGARYYEFDLSSAFYNDIFGAWEDAQTVTFNAYGDNHTGDTSYGAITIPITKGMATMVGGKYSHLGTFSAINVSNGNVYGMNDSGTAFDDASSLSTVTPFRTYMSPTATRSNARYDYTSVINIAEQNADNIMPDMEENEDDTQKEDHITVRAIGNQRVRIESTMATRLNVVTVAGQLYRILDVQPGIATYSDFQPGLYIFGTTKVIVR